MFIDTAVRPTHHASCVKILLVVAVLALMAKMGATWWQYTAVLVVFIACLWVDTSHATPVRELSTKHPDDIWYLGVYDGDERQVWQAYLSCAKRVGRAVQLEFDVMIPFEGRHQLVIYPDSVSDGDFRQLSSLV